MKTSAALAHSITWKSSKQSYLTALLLADRDLVDDCLRGYAYFRWADDLIDISLSSRDERTAFLARQKTLIKKLYSGQRPMNLCPEEEMIADLIAHDRNPDSGLYSFIHNFMAVIEFDSNRRGHLVNRDELATYTVHLANAVMDGLQYFIGNGYPYPRTPDRTMAVTGAHIMHMLRDMLEDIPDGIVNIPVEAIKEHGICMDDLDNESFCMWVQAQVEKARQAFQAGKCYIDSIDILRCKLAGIWYLARFECILKTIERDKFRLRSEYPEQHCLAAWIGVARLGIKATGEYTYNRIRQVLPGAQRQVALQHEVSMRSYPAIK